jgi:hypothetical protein
MKKLGFIFLLCVLIVSCAPRTVPAAEAVLYKASQADLFAAVVQSISTSPGLDDSNGWIITQSDSAGGFITAETLVNVCGFLGLGCETVSERLSVVVSSANNETSQVVIQGTQRSAVLAQRVRDDLERQFLRAN